MTANILSGIMALAILGLCLLYYQGGRYIRNGQAASFKNSSGPWPPAAVIVPVAGVYPELLENLRSRLTQNYPHYQVVFAVRSADDPAIGVINKLLPKFPQAQLAICGPASGCSQKNHNLLGGLEAIGPDVKILVFSDANQMTPAHWLQALVQPLAFNKSAISGSYHHVIPQDLHLATLGRSLAVFMIYLGKGISSWDQPWGGSTAILRKTFEELEVRRLWSHTVVDDVSLAKRLQQAKIPIIAATGAVLATPARETMASWEEWFIRQLIYLKFYFYFPWLMAGVGIFALLALVLLALAQVGLGLFGWNSWNLTGMSLLFLFTLIAFLTLLRPLHPRPGPWLLYLNAGLLTLAMAAWCHLKTWFTWDIRWRKLIYTVDRQGTVTRIQEL
jgi:ceramide glucosyltransferase